MIINFLIIIQTEIMDLFVCSSHYQLLNAISIVNEYNIEADLMIISDSIANNCKLEVLYEEHVFQSIFIWTDIYEMLTDEKIKTTMDKVCMYMKKINVYARLRKIWDTIPNKDKTYEKVHIAYVDSITLSVYSFFKRTGASLSLFEDGTYTYGCLSIKKSIIRSIAERIIFGSQGIDECNQVFVKHPDMLDKGKFSDIILMQFSGKPDEYTLNTIILPLYRTSSEIMEKFKKRVIFFDGNLELDELKAMQKKIAIKTTNILGVENVLVKLHPSSRDLNYGDNIDTFNGKIPFEIVMTYEQMERKVLISIFSTACMAPKRDFGQEPYVIFTYKLFKENFSISSQYLNQIDQLREIYINKEKIYVPSSMEEYMQTLKLIREEIGCGF